MYFLPSCNLADLVIVTQA
uniref:Uncharacterized protein n=1 Tax=Anguilla anguilla TaxID=7936 RepID=A0A0E9PEM4_ANGAN